MTRNWAVIQHVAFEGPGLIAEAAANHGVKLHTHRMDLGEPLPDLADVGGLVVLGGPMGVYETDDHPYLAGEIRLLPEAIRQDLPVLGVCLGAQLLAAASGAAVTSSGPGEIGPGAVTLASAARTDPVLAGAPNPLPVFHWHGDTFTHPPGAVQLAATDTYAQQAFRLGRHVYGFQFHVELAPSDVVANISRLPAGLKLDHDALTRTAEHGRRILTRFFDHATAPHSVAPTAERSRSG